MSPILYVVTPYLIVAFSLLTLWRDVDAQNWGNAAFAALNAFLASWAIVAYIGIWNSVVDIWVGLTKFLYVEKRRTTSSSAARQGEPELDWRAVLYHGHAGATVPLEVLRSARASADAAAVGVDAALSATSGSFGSSGASGASVSSGASGPAVAAVTADERQVA